MPAKTVKLKSGVTVDIESTQHAGPLTAVKFKKDNGWCITTIGGVGCIGTLHEIHQGAIYHLEGQFVENTQYSTWDFKFKSYTVNVNTTNGIRELLIKECPGLGPSLANRLVTKFQSQTLKVIETEPGKIADFLKIGFEDASRISEWAKGQAANLDMKQRLYKIGITQGKVKKIIDLYGMNAEQKIKKDCFDLTKVHGFGFKTVAQIADLIGVPADDPGRLRAALKYSIDELSNEGHSCLHCNDVIRKAFELTAVNQSKLKPHLQSLLELHELISEHEPWDEYKKTNNLSL